MSWIKITEVGNIPLHEGRSVPVGKRELAVFNLGVRFAAIDNRCPHNGGPLCDGIVSASETGFAVVCPLHGWKICLETGTIVRPQVPVCVDIYPARVEDGVVVVDVPDGSPMEDRNTGVAA
jgi:nitrite reductase (NADH) small subunit